MRWTEMTISVGFLIILLGAGLTFLHVARRLRWLRDRAPGASARRLDGIAEIASQAVLFGGMALLNFGNLAEHIVARTLPSHLWLSLLGSAAMLVLFGVHLGRLLTRWQLQHLGDTLDTRTGEFATRA